MAGLLLILPLLVSQAPTPPDAAPTALTRLQGSWRGQYTCKQRQAPGGFDILQDRCTQITSPSSTFYTVGKLRVTGQGAGEFDLQNSSIHGDRVPTPEPVGTWLGLYRLEGNTLTVGLNPPGDARPTTVEAAETVFRLSRATQP